MTHIFVLFDFETTGLNPFKNNRAVQLGAILLRAKNKDNIYFNEIIHPQIPVSKYSKAFRTHKISIHKIRKEKPFAYKFKKFIEWLHTVGHDSKIVLCAHNCFDFDSNFLVMEIIRAGFTIPFDIYLSDSLHIFRKWFPNEKSHSLPILYENILKKELVGAHDALADVNAMRKLMCYYNKTQTKINSDYNIENDMIKICKLKSLKEEILKIKEKIRIEKINLNPEIYYIYSDEYTRHIIRQDGGKWDDIKREYYYTSEDMYTKAREKNRITYSSNII